MQDALSKFRCISRQRIDDQLTNFFQASTELMQVTKGIGHVRKKAKQHFITWLSDRSGWAPDTIRDTVGLSLDQLFAQVEESLGQVRPAHLDPRFIDLFIVRA